MLNYLAAYALIQKRLYMCHELYLTSVNKDDIENFHAGYAAGVQAIRVLDNCLTQIDSKIEQLMFGILLGLHVPEYGIYFETTQDDIDYTIHDGSNPYDSIVVDPQLPIKGYVLDFMLSFYVNDTFYHVGIECDGHAFHEKTKEQAAHDKKRDRELAAEGIQVLRFTGSEIWRDPIKVQKEIENYIGTVIKNKQEAKHAD